MTAIPKSVQQAVRRFFLGTLRLFGALATLALLASCAAPRSLYQEVPAKQLFWPPQLSSPRIAWVKTIADSTDVGITKGFWTRALEVFIGEDTRRIERPRGVLFDSAERLYISDPAAGVVHCMDTREGRYSIIGGTARSPLRTPIGLAEDGQGTLLITDSTAGAVFRYNREDGSLHPIPIKELQRPTGITFSRLSGLFYVVDTLGSQIIAIDPQGKERLRFGAYGAGPGEFNRPTDIAVDNRGLIYVTDALNYKIRVYSGSGVRLSDFGSAGDAAGDFNKPKGIAVDSAGQIYVSDALMDVVQVFDESGHLLIAFGSKGSGDGAFWMPSGLYIDSRDYIYVADSYNQRIQIFRFTDSDNRPAIFPGKPSPGRTALPHATEKP